MTTEQTSLVIGLSIGLFSAASTLVSAWILVRTKLATLEARIVAVERETTEDRKALNKHKDDYKADLQRLYDKQDETIRAINDLKVELQNKADRK